MFDRDRLMNARRSEVSQAAFSVLDAVQDYRKEVAVASVGILLGVLTERFKLTPDDVMSAAGNVLRETGDPRFDQYITALREFVKNEF